MSENPLKPGWKRVKFGDLVAHVAERAEPKPEDNPTYIGLEHLDSGSLTVRRWGSPTTLIGTKLRIKKGDILFARRNAYLRRVAIAPHDGLFSAHGMVLRPKPPHIVPEFLPFFMQSDIFMDRAEQISVGSLSPTINWTSLREEEFVLPPLEEQRKTAKALDATEVVIQALSDAFLHLSSITRRLLESFNLDTLPTAPTETLLLEPPKNGVSPSCNDSGRGRPTLPVGCVYSGIVNTASELKYAEIDDDSFLRFRLCRDDILVVRGNGNRSLVGRAGIVTEEVSNCFYPDLLIRLRFDPEKLVPALAVHLWNCVPIHGNLVRRSKSTNGIYKINGADIRAHLLPVPPASMQKMMLESVSAHADCFQLVMMRLELAQQGKRNILKASTEGIAPLSSARSQVVSIGS